MVPSHESHHRVALSDRTTHMHCAQRADLAIVCVGEDHSSSVNVRVSAVAAQKTTVNRPASPMRINLVQLHPDRGTDSHGFHARPLTRQSP